MLRFIDQEDQAPIQPAPTPAASTFDTSKLEQDMGDQAGLKPLPLGRMFQQAGRPMSPEARRQDTPWYGKNTNLNSFQMIF